MLHITNGDHAAQIITETGLGGVVLSWKDVLHEGPVPAGLSLEQLRGIRAAFIADQGWGEYAKVHAELTRRDETLLRVSDHEEINLWFEHDLFDQLQLVQILTVLPGEALERCSIIHPDKKDYIGQLSIVALRTLYEKRIPVVGTHVVTARRAWDAFRSPDPSAMLAYLREGNPALPSVGQALLRHCQQYPSQENGLSRTERQILETLNSRSLDIKTLFTEAHHKREEMAFMGDTVFVSYVQRLGYAETPLVANDPRGPLVVAQGEEFWRARVRITSAGRAVLRGEEDIVRLNGIDRWLGGVYLSGKEVPWRWDQEHLTLRVRG